MREQSTIQISTIAVIATVVAANISTSTTAPAIAIPVSIIAAKGTTIDPLTCSRIFRCPNTSI